MDLTTFQAELENKISEIENLIEQMPYKGDKCETSQKICLTQALNEFGYAVNGIEQSDLKEINDEEE